VCHLYSHTVDDQELHWSRRLLGLFLVNLEPPLPQLRRKLDQQGSFEVIESQETVPDQPSEEPTISNLGEKSLGPSKTPTTDPLMPIIVQIYPYGFQRMLQVAMETNVATSFRNSHIPSTIVTTGGVLPPNPPSLVQDTMVSSASTLSNGLILSMVVAIAPFTQSVTGPSFSYRMPSSSTSPVLSFSTL
jgi:hypothetical protein